MPLLGPLNLQSWIDAHRDALKPPVGNQRIYEDSEFIVMVVGGPNARKDYHINQSEELFYQIEGDIVLKVVEEGVFRDIPIRAGDMFLLPPNIPHSPQRGAGTVGLVIERRRREGETDALRWYCSNCGSALHEARFPLTDIVHQLRHAIESFSAREDLRTCGSCGHIETMP